MKRLPRNPLPARPGAGARVAIHRERRDNLLVRLSVPLALSCWLVGVIAFGPVAFGHDVITTKITFNREILRILYPRCAACHRPGGSAFSLLTYSEARPWAKAIQEEVLERRMPPWGAVKGFGDFRGEQALTPEQIEVIADWVEGGAPEGEDKDLPPPLKLDPPAKVAANAGAAVASGNFRLSAPLILGGLLPRKVPEGLSFQITAELPDGSILPLLWLQPFKPAYGHAFYFREPLELPKGTAIRGVPEAAQVVLLPSHKNATSP